MLKRNPWWYSQWTVMEDLNGSDHFPIVIEKKDAVHVARERKYSRKLTGNCSFNWRLWITSSWCSRTVDTGEDRIAYEMLKHTHSSASIFFLKIFNQIWLQNIYLDTWRNVIVLSFAKPNKPPTRHNWIIAKVSRLAFIIILSRYKTCFFI